MEFPANALSFLWTHMGDWLGGSEESADTGVGEDILVSCGIVPVIVVAPREKAV